MPHVLEGWHRYVEGWFTHLDYLSSTFLMVVSEQQIGESI